MQSSHLTTIVLGTSWGPAEWAAFRRGLIKILVITNLILGAYYLLWRGAVSLNWNAWLFALALFGAELYSYIGSFLFGLTVFRLRERGEPPPAPSGLRVDVFITCYNEPVELVRKTVRAAIAIRYPHQTYLLDDGNSPAMRAMAAEEGCGYITRSAVWKGFDRHAKAGNLINALEQTTGDFVLILDADQVPLPQILDRTLGYFADPLVALVQTPQYFINVPPGDPFGSQAPLFYGPIQQGKDGWNAAFFCGSNAVLRREALARTGLRFFVRDVERRIRRALREADTVIRQAERRLTKADRQRIAPALRELRRAVAQARRELDRGDTFQEVTERFQRRAEEAARMVVAADLQQIMADLAEIQAVEAAEIMRALNDEALLAELAARDRSPLAAIETVRQLIPLLVNEAMDYLPISTISVTEDMSTAMRMHATGWRSVYHDEILAHGLAPEDLRSALQQRLRWAQGTIQVMLRENPLTLPGLSLGQRLAYFDTMWSYLSGVPTIIYLISPVLYLVFGLLPVNALSDEFFWRLAPYLIINQLLFAVISWGRPTWRGQQYSLALFPLWIKAVTTAAANVWFGKKLGFIVTPKTRQAGRYFGLVRWQLMMMALLAIAIVVGLGQLALGWRSDGLPVVVNVFWAVYDLVMLSVVIDAAMYQPTEEQ
ncbi:cellulose synthase [Chloroflexus islandicus]|uniref:Cellulose synthase n=1 Tax=Chloroflexus islandicus TaxID=1707952 RepID=A0A178M1V7_9CHLR|nr:glycosyltransferase [Chloroflexus islandicus]OAN40830.1 cellulose synthase [Chloroflexus islandicus]